MGIYNDILSDNFLQIHFVIMKSENDIILPWPFLNKVTYKLIYQNKKLDSRHEDLIKTYEPYLQGSSGNKFLRPTLDENERWTNSFCPLRRLSGNYLWNNTVIIKLFVHDVKNQQAP